jgi:hypothetical protein
LKNSQQTTGLFRQLRRLFADDSAVVNLHLQCEIAHGFTLTEFPRLANCF